ncbi:uncharacterized protein ZBIST_2579 [Zygosaccharomyces bailii]|nr:uncharacterized protein ZBIST_2579 [Zygosaccharomyces bailii]
MTHIVIAGAGVIGLSIAHQLLLSSTRTDRLTLIARNFPQDDLTSDYTSPWAGAHFRPFPHRPESYESDARESRYTRVSYEFFKRLCVEHPESTIKFLKGMDWLEAPSREYEELGPGYNATSLDSFKRCKELPAGVKFGCEYLTYCLNAPEYLKFLQNAIVDLCKKQNVQLEFLRITLPSLKYVKKIYPDCSLLFNATGLGLQYEGGYDDACYKVRGQTLLLNISGPTPYAFKTVTHQSRNGDWTFVIRRSDNHYILGGTKQEGDDYPLPRESDTQRLLKSARKIFPDLDTSQVIHVNVGFRPLRRGGSRVESSSYPGMQVVHAYGLGGMGFEASVGVAKHALSLSRPAKL